MMFNEWCYEKRYDVLFTSFFKHVKNFERINTYYFAWRANATIAEACGAEKDVPSRLLLLTHVEFRDVEVCNNKRYQFMRIRIGYIK